VRHFHAIPRRAGRWEVMGWCTASAGCTLPGTLAQEPGSAHAATLAHRSHSWAEAVPTWNTPILGPVTLRRKGFFPQLSEIFLIGPLCCL